MTNEIITANELRIGNWVESFSKQYRKIDHLDIRDVAEWRLIEPYRPIPLTPEILEKCGFKWHGGDHYELSDCWIEDYKGGYRIVRPDFCKTIFKNLHQLQNLYFTLTGNELTINL